MLADRSLFDLLWRVAQSYPDQLALLWSDPGSPQTLPVPWNYGELLSRSLAASHDLKTSHGIGAGDRVVWLGLNHPAQLVLLFALARLGAMLVPLNHRLAQAEWLSVLKDCTPSLLVHDENFADAACLIAPATSAPLCTLAAHALANASAAPELHHAPSPNEWDTPALLVYTSGTTGLPKAAVHTQGNLLANMAMAAQVQSLTASDTVLTVLPLFHVGGLCIQTLPALSVGAKVVLHARFDPSATLDALAIERPTLTLQVPATLKALCEHARWPTAELGSLRALWAGSSLLPPTTVAAFHARGIPVCNVYGSTETGPFSIALPPEHAQSHAGSCGWPAPGVTVTLRDAEGQAVADGEVGELCLRAPNVVQRYWPDVPAVDEQGFFASGDLAQKAPDGSYTVVGRSKDMIISGGENVYPAEIENLLAAHPLVRECCVVGQPDARWGEVAVAVVVVAASAPEVANAAEDWAAPLQQFLQGQLARYKWPRRWVRVEALPKTALGKVQKPAVKAMLL